MAQCWEQSYTPPIARCPPEEYWAADLWRDSGYNMLLPRTMRPRPRDMRAITRPLTDADSASEGQCLLGAGAKSLVPQRQV